MNVLLLTSHAIAEHDDLDMFTRMGVDCYSIGGAYDEVPFEGKRPAIAGVKRFPELEAATSRQRAHLSETLGDPGPAIDWGKAKLAPEVIDWADTIIVHHFPEQWIGGQWTAIRDKRVIWRTCGQSDPRLESVMSHYRRQGLEIVRYSPKEREAFPKMGAFAGEDVMIRFGKDPDEWSGWTGDGRVSVLGAGDVAIGKPSRDSRPFVGNITQHMKQRGDSCGYPFWAAATEGLEAHPAGPGSEELPGGMGSLDYEDMKAYLRAARVYLYTGTRPASYTLGLIEAMMTGVPVLSIGPGDFQPSELFEAHELVDGSMKSGDARFIRRLLESWYIGDDRKESTAGIPDEDSEYGRKRAIELFGLDGVMAQWADYLGLAS